MPLTIKPVKIGIHMNLKDMGVLEKWQNAIYDEFKTPLRECAGVIWKSIAQNFKEGGRPTWVPLSPITLAIRARRYFWGSKRRILPTTDILVETGAMRSAATGGSGSLVRITKEYFAVYLTKQNGISDRGWLHQLGGIVPFFKTGKMAHIPARPFMVVQDEDVEAFVEIFKRHAVGTFARLGGQT